MPTSREFPLSKIWFNRESRQRRDLGDLTDLKTSIASLGLLNPIIITDEGELVAGERRFTAAKELGLVKVPVRIFSDLSDLEKEQVELDENIRRKELTWQERSAAIGKYHSLCLRIAGKDPWTQYQTADQLGLNRAHISKVLQVAEAMTKGDETIIEAPTLATAIGLIERRNTRLRAAADEEVTNAIRAAIPLAPGQEPAPAKPQLPTLPVKLETPIICANFNEWASTYSGPSFNLLHCDFPYGINADKMDSAAHPSFGSYSDTPEDYQELLSTLKKCLLEGRVVAKSAHMLFWFATKTYTYTFEVLSEMGWAVNPTPLVWFRSDGSGIIPDPKRMPRQVYETAFLCSFGDRPLVRPRANLIGAPNLKTIHMSEKPLPALEHFLSMLVDDTTTLLDPTCGSGNALIAARRLKAKAVMGLELNPEFTALAQENWRNAD